MKTRSLMFLGVLLAVFMTLGTTERIQAQQQHIKSDTIKFRSSDSVAFYLNEFGFLNHGEKACHTIFLQNLTGATVIINSLRSQYSTADFTATSIPTLPMIMLSGEIVSITNLCFAPTNSSIDTSGSINLVIDYSYGSSKGEIRAGTYGFTSIDPALLKPCVTGSMDADVFGPIIMDGDITHTATIENNRYDSIMIRNDSGIYGDASYFHISGITFPYLLSPREKKNFNVTYSPRSNDPQVRYRSVGLISLQSSLPMLDNSGHTQYWNNCEFIKLSLPGVAIPPTADSIATSLAAGSTDVLAMIGDNSVTTKTFHFTNTTSMNLKITGVSLKNGKSFSITDILPTTTLPFTLIPGQSMSVTVSMTTVANGVYYDEVVITAEQGLMSMTFQLQGLRKNGVLGVFTNLRTSQHVTIYPNPTIANITIAMPGIRNAKIEVLDILGTVITNTTASELWNYNCTQPTGTYIVHISGTDATGKFFESYDRFIVQK